MKTPLVKWLRLAVLGLAGFALGQPALATDIPVLNAGFDAATSNLANSWNDNGGSIRGGAEGGFGWDASYFGGSFPTNSTFASTLNGPVRQELTGPGSTFVGGATYELKVDLFSSSTYNADRSRMWTLALTAGGTVVARDQWFSDEFAAQSVANGGTIPNDHIITVNASSTGLTTAKLSFTVPPEFAGQAIGIQLGGDTSSVYSLASGSPATDDYYGMMDNVSLTVSEELIAAVDFFVTDATHVGGDAGLSWYIVNPSVLNTLTLDDGSGPVSVMASTNLTTGEGFIFVNPTVTTTYTLKANGASTKQLTILGGDIQSFTSSSGIATAANGYQVTLNWQIYPPGFPVKISDGTTLHDVTADTDGSGSGSRSFTVPNAITTFTLDLNQASDTAIVQVLRAGGNSPAFSLNKTEYASGEATTATWSGTTGNPDSWIGIYTSTKVPDTNVSDQWNYLNGTRTAGGNHPAGTMNFTLPPGDYYAVLFIDEGYVIEQGPIAFKVIEPPAEEPRLPVVSVVRSGSTLTIEWDSQAGREYKVYASENLEGNPETDWNLIAPALPSSGDGTTTFTETLSNPAPARRFYRIYEVNPGI